MAECHLQQTGLAEVMGVPLDRVKSLTSGKVKNLKREESQALIDKLGVRAEWLVTGEGSMFRKDETQDEFISRHQAIGRMRKLLDAMPMRDITRMRVAVLLTGDPERDGPLIAEALSAEARGLDLATGEPINASRPMPARAALPPRAQALLDNYEAADEAGKRYIERAADHEAQSGGKRAARSGQR